MKTLVLSVLVILVFVTSAFAWQMVGFGAYSAQAPTSCAVLAGTAGLSVNNVPIPYLNPNATISRVLSLNTKGYANYSGYSLGARIIQVNCYQTNAPATAVTVKMFFDGSLTKLFPLSTTLLYVRP